MIRCALMLCLAVLGDPALAAQETPFEQHAARWEADVQEFFRLQDDFRKLSDGEKAQFLAEKGLTEETWRKLGSHITRWLETPAGFEAARGQLADQLEPIEGFSMERYAGVAARLVNGEELEAVLPELGIDEPTWEKVQGGWGARMGRDRARVLTTLYSHYFLAGLEGEHTAAARDASRAMLPGGTLQGPEPVPFERYVEIQAAISVGASRGLDAASIPRDHFGLSFADWIAVSNWWGAAMRTEEVRRKHVSRMGALMSEYRAKAEALFEESEAP